MDAARLADVRADSAVIEVAAGPGATTAGFRDVEVQERTHAVEAASLAELCGRRRCAPTSP